MLYPLIGFFPKVVFPVRVGLHRFLVERTHLCRDRWMSEMYPAKTGVIRSVDLT